MLCLIKTERVPFLAVSTAELVSQFGSATLPQIYLDDSSIVVVIRYHHFVDVTRLYRPLQTAYIIHTRSTIHRLAAYSISFNASKSKCLVVLPGNRHQLHMAHVVHELVLISENRMELSMV